MGLATSKDYNHRMKERFSEVSQWKLDVSACHVLLHIPSLRSRRLEVVGTRKNGRARRRHATPLACLPRARPFSLSLATSKRLLRRLAYSFCGYLRSTSICCGHEI